MNCSTHEDKSTGAYEDYYECLLSVLDAFQALKPLYSTQASNWDDAVRTHYGSTLLCLAQLGESFYQNMVNAVGVKLADGGDIFSQ